MRLKLTQLFRVVVFGPQFTLLARFSYQHAGVIRITKRLIMKRYEGVE